VNSLHQQQSTGRVVLPPSELELMKSSGKPVPICSYCHRVRLDNGDPWNQDSWMKVNVDLHKEPSISLSHGICPTCLKGIAPGVKH